MSAPPELAVFVCLFSSLAKKTLDCFFNRCFPLLFNVQYLTTILGPFYPKGLCSGIVYSMQAMPTHYCYIGKWVRVNVLGCICYLSCSQMPDVAYSSISPLYVSRFQRGVEGGWGWIGGLGVSCALDQRPTLWATAFSGDIEPSHLLSLSQSLLLLQLSRNSIRPIQLIPSCY